MEKPLPCIQVSSDGRYLVTEDGKPFFWLTDTAWEFFHRLDREQAMVYLDNRQKKGFNGIQAVILAEDGPDWVLVVDDAGKQFPPPGRSA
jgi:hypothetical protein